MNAPVAQTNGNGVLLQGRLIWILGQSIFEGKQKTDQTTKQVIMDTKTGNPVVEYGFGLAIPKIDPRTGQNHPEYIKAWQALQAEALTMFPSGQVPPSFAMKYKDGDTAVDEQGRPYRDREGYAGHFVISCTTRIPIKGFVFQGGNNILVTTGINNGDYVNVQLNIKAHPAAGQSKAGLYVNPSAVQLIAKGKEIINTPSGDQLFGMAAPQYAGQVEAPVHTMPGQDMSQQMGPPGGMPMNQNPPMQQQQMAQPQQNFQGPPQQQVQQNFDPNYGVLPPQHQPQQQTTQAPPQQQMGPPMGQPGMNQGMPQQQQFQQPQQGYQNQPMGQPQMNQGMPPQQQQFQQPINNGYPQQQNQMPGYNGMPQ